MRGRFTTACILLTVLIVWGLPRPLAAQSTAAVTGTVTDSVAGRPLSGVSVGVRDAKNAVVAALVTNTTGAFTFVASKPGSYVFELRKPGYRPMKSPAIRVDSGPPTALAIRMSPAVTALDTVVAEAQMETFGLTPGRELFRRHVLENKGQFVSGTEIMRSHLSVSEYLGTLPGIRLTNVMPVTLTPGVRLTAAPQPIAEFPSIPGANHQYLVAASQGHCLYGRVDRFFIPDLLLIKGLMSIDDLFKVEDITGVEVYIVQRDIPAEWRMWAYPPYFYNVGDPYNVAMGTITPHLEEMVPLIPGTRKMANVAGAPLLTSPAVDGAGCGFIQIWTRIAW